MPKSDPLLAEGRMQSLGDALARQTRPGELYERLPDHKVRCYACGHRCLILDGHDGICRVWLKPVVARVEPKPVPARQPPPAPPPPNSVPEHQDGVADPRKPRGKFASLMSAFRRKPTPEVEPAPAKPPSREEIHAGLSTTFSKIGLEMPKPPPPSSRPKI